MCKYVKFVTIYLIFTEDWLNRNFENLSGLASYFFLI